MRTRLLSAALVSTVASLLACGDSGSGPASGPPTHIIVLDGAGQTGVFGQPTPIVPSVLVTDVNNQPLRGVSVTFVVSPGGGSVGLATAKTDDRGSATPGEWKLGSSFATMALTATVTGLPPVNFTAKAIAPDAGVLAFTLADPAGDTLPTASTTNPKAHDLLSMRGDFKRDSLILTLTFAEPVSATVLGSATALAGFIEIDTDESTTTGSTPLSNSYGASATAGIDYIISLAGNTPTTVRLIGTGGTSGTLNAAYTGNTLVIRIPMQALGNDDGRFTVVGVMGTIDRPTDVFPNSSALTVRPGSDIVALSATRSGRHPMPFVPHAPRW